MHALCSTCSSKCSKGNILFETPHASIINIIILFIYLFIAIIFFSFSLGPDNPPHPWLISRKGTGSAVCSGLSFKKCMFFLWTHTAARRGAGFLPPVGEENHRQIKTPHRVMTCMTTACMHTRQISAEGEDTSWVERRYREETEAMLVWGCVCLCRNGGFVQGGRSSAS